MKTQMTDEERDALIERVTQALDVPEPSPLFWEHFPERVRAAVAAAPPAPAPAWWRRPVAALALAASLVIAGGVWMVRPDPSTPASPVASNTSGGAGGVEPLDDAGWSIVTSAAATAGLDALGEAGFGVAPGDADAALEDLTQAERAAFVAMLQAELKGRDAGGL